MSEAAPTRRVRVVRERQRAAYDRATIDAILDEALVAHLGFVHDGQPFVIPTLHARAGDRVYVHGSAASRALRSAAGGLAACLTVTLLDGLVLARSAFEHSVNYRSVVLLGRLTAVEAEEEKLRALEAFTDALIPGRWAEARPPSSRELKATSILAMGIDEASAKLRTGGPDDGDGPDATLPVWAGHLPLHLQVGEPVPDPSLPPAVPVPASVHALRARRNP